VGAGTSRDRHRDRHHRSVGPRLAAHDLAPSQVWNALAQNNYLSALGRTKGSMVSVNLVANTNLKTADEFRQLVVKEKDGVVVRLGEVSDVELGAETYEQDVRFNGQTATFMGIWVLPNANALEVIKLKEFFTLLEDALDRCEDVANIVETIMVKHS